MEPTTSDFETKLVLRQLTLDDYDDVVALQLACFPDMRPWQPNEFEGQISTFPEGQLGIEIEGKLVATAASLIVDSADYDAWHDWKTISASGTIENHDPEGDTLYGIEIQVHPEYRGRKLARRLYDARKNLCYERRIARIVIGGRIPGYAKVQEEMTAQEYVVACVEKRLFDPVLTTQLANGFVVKRIVRDYLPSDEDSAGYATILEWSNLDYEASHRRRQPRGVHYVRVVDVQYQMRRISKFEEFAQQVEFFVDTGSDYRADFVVFPELFTLQNLCLVDPKLKPAEAARTVAEKFTPRYLELMTKMAVRYAVNIVGGTHLVLRDDRLYNVAYLFRRDGTIVQQDKIHPTPNEVTWWGLQGGEGCDAIETDCGKIGILVCYDVQFPEVCRHLADQGAQILFVPYNTNDLQGHNRVTICSQARAIENHLYVVTSGCVGNLPFVQNADVHYARSGVYTPSDVGFPRDAIAAQASSGQEAVLIQELDTQMLRRHRMSGTVRNWHNRRRDLYRVRWLKDDRDI